MKIQKSLQGTIAQALAAGALAALCASAQAEPGCPSGKCPSPARQAAAVPAPGATAVVPAGLASPKVQLWVAPRESSLREVLSQWAAAAGWQEPVWRLKPEEDFTLGASFEHTGEIAEAVPALFDAFPAEFNLHVRMYAANSLIVVEQAHE